MKTTDDVNRKEVVARITCDLGLYIQHSTYSHKNMVIYPLNLSNLEMFLHRLGICFPSPVNVETTFTIFAVFASKVRCCRCLFDGIYHSSESYAAVWMLVSFICVHRSNGQTMPVFFVRLCMWNTTLQLNKTFKLTALLINYNVSKCNDRRALTGRNASEYIQRQQQQAHDEVKRLIFAECRLLSTEPCGILSPIRTSACIQPIRMRWWIIAFHVPHQLIFRLSQHECLKLTSKACKSRKSQANQS